MEKGKKAGVARHVNGIASLIGKGGAFKERLNRRMEGKYSPKLIALAGAAGAAVLMVWMLFIPNYLGVAGDDSVAGAMDSAGVAYIGEGAEENGYFERVYSNVRQEDGMQEKGLTSHTYIIHIAVRLDNLITGDKFFDIRFLGLIYGILYVPAVYLLIGQACMRVKNFSEGMAVGAAGALAFADVAYLTWFNSFYVEAVWFISLLYCLGAALSFQEARSFAGDVKALALLAGAGIVLMTSSKQCASIGMVLAFFCLKLVFDRREWKWGVICVLTGLVLSLISAAGMVRMESEFDRTDQFHAMTRGVLFGADNPVKALEEFGIDPFYEMLTDVSAYDELPLITAEDEALKEGFLDRYTSVDIAMYYLRHPGKFIRMWDAAIKSCFGIRRDYLGNYEQSAGLPAGAKSIFWSMWSTFKNHSAPKTIGYLVILMAAACLLFGKGYSLRPEEDRKNIIFMDSMAVLLLICFLQAGITIVNSGDAKMIQHCFMISAAIDIMTYIVFAEIVHRIKIF